MVIVVAKYIAFHTDFAQNIRVLKCVVCDISDVKNSRTTAIFMAKSVQKGRVKPRNSPYILCEIPEGAFRSIPQCFVEDAHLVVSGALECMIAMAAESRPVMLPDSKS
jgi:hypothetical protein